MIHAVVVFGLGKDFLFKSILGHCEAELKKVASAVIGKTLQKLGITHISWK